MKKKIIICLAAAFTTLVGGSELAARPADDAGCTIAEFSNAVTIAQQMCRTFGYDGGYAAGCTSGDGTNPDAVEAQCWNL